MRGQVADVMRARGHDLDTSELNVLDNPSKKIMRKQQRASRRSANNLPETLLTNAEMNSVGAVALQSHTAAAMPSLRGSQANNSSWAPPWHAGPSACMSLGRGVVRKRRERSRRAARPVSNELLSRSPASSPHHEPLSSCTEGGPDEPRTHCRWKRW